MSAKGTASPKRAAGDTRHTEAPEVRRRRSDRAAQSAARIVNLVRGVNPWPGAWTALPGGGVLKIWKARAVEGEGVPGQVLCGDGKRGMSIACGEGILEILEMQAPNARRMPARDYLGGHPLGSGLLLGTEDM